MIRSIGTTFVYNLLPQVVSTPRAHIFGMNLSLLSSPPFSSTFSLFRPRLLHVDVNAPENQKELDPHQDERQIRLDTDRSFVLYPVGDALSHTLIVSLSLTPNLQTTVWKMTDLLARQSSIILSYNYFDGTPV
jgi:hypothetical protein